MIAVALVAVALYAVLTAAVGVRLLALWWSTRQLPELLLGLADVLAGVLGWAVILVAGAVRTSAPELSLGMVDVGLFFFSTGNLALALFCWRVFAPRSAWARSLFLAIVALLAVDYAHNVFVSGVPFPPSHSAWYYPGMVGRTASFAWAPVAALGYYAQLRRRLELGLADPLVANRVLLWGLSSLAMLASTAVVVAGTIAGPLDTPSTGSPAREPIVMTGLALVALGAIGQWLAFLPPRRYVAWVEARARRDAVS